MLIFVILKLFQVPPMRDFYKKEVMGLLLFSLYLAKILDNIQMLWYFLHVICLQFKDQNQVFSLLIECSFDCINLFFYFLLVDSRDLCYRANLTICFSITHLLGSVHHLWASINILFYPAIDKMDINFKFSPKI